MTNVAVIGYGYWGPNLARNFAALEQVHLTGICDLSPERTKLAGRLYPGARTTTNPSELIGDDSIDAVVIATPVATHFELALQALQSGKHVLVEKPLTSTSREGQRLIEEAERRQRVLMVDHTFNYTGAVRKIRALIEGGDLGDVYYYDSVRVNLGLFQSDVSVLWDLAVHDLSIMDFLLASHPVAVSATAMSHVRGEPENVAYLTLFFDGNLIAHVHVNWLAPVKVRKTLIGGSQKMIVYDDLEPSEKVKVYDKGITVGDNTEARHQTLIGYRTGDMMAPKLEGAEALRTEMAHFIDCIATGRPPLTDGRAGLRVVQILEAATQSMGRRGDPVELKMS
jgi:predicted dehydrogenase